MATKEVTIGTEQISRLKELRTMQQEAQAKCVSLEQKIARKQTEIATAKDELASEVAGLAETKASLEQAVKSLPKEFQDLAEAFLNGATHHHVVAKQSGERMNFEQKMEFVQHLVEENGGQLSLSAINKAYTNQTGKQAGPLKKDIENCTLFKITGKGRQQVVKLA